MREKFQQAQTQLVERLGEASWQRHRDVRQRRDQINNATEELPSPAVAEGDGDGEQMPHSMFRPYSSFHDSGIGTSVPAQTTYAASHASFQSSNTEGGRTFLRVPPTPGEVSIDKPFQCCYCGNVLLKIKNRVDWKWVFFPSYLRQTM